MWFLLLLAVVHEICIWIQGFAGTPVLYFELYNEKLLIGVNECHTHVNGNNLLLESIEGDKDDIKEGQQAEIGDTLEKFSMLYRNSLMIKRWSTFKILTLLG